MRRYRRAELEPEPWIERLIQNYGQSRREVSERAHVVGVSDLSDSVRTDESDACMLFLSDGSVFIPAVLSAAAWERLQELEERETFSGLDNTTVSVRKFQLNFHMDPELTSCQFYLTIDQMISVGRVTRHYHPPSCTTLPSVKQQILKTWRSLMKESSVNSVNSQSGFPLSCLMGAWHNDIILHMLNNAVEKITTPTGCHSGVATPTHWHTDRLLCRGEECFSAPVSHLRIPEEQRELLTADPGASSGSETPSGLALPHGDVMTNRPVTAQYHEKDSPTMAVDRPADLEQLPLDHTRPEVWCGGGEGGEGVSPWDMFYPAPDLLGTPSTCSETSIEPLSQKDSGSLLTIAPQVPMATSTQVWSSNPSPQEKSRSSITPYQRPRLSPHSSSHLSKKTIPDQTHHEQQEQPGLSPPTWLTKNIALSTQDTSSKEPPAKRSPTVSPPAKKGWVHSDGSVFSYTYEPCPQVVSSLSQFKVPEQLVQWAVTYLGTPQHTLIANGRTELREATMVLQIQN